MRACVRARLAPLLSSYVGQYRYLPSELKQLLLLLPLLLLFNKQYILYTILLLSEGVAACASRLGNLIILAHFGALASVKYHPLNRSPKTTTTPKPETFAEMGSPTTTIEPERETFAKNNQQQRRPQISPYRWGRPPERLPIKTTFFSQMSPYRWGRPPLVTTTTTQLQQQISPYRWGRLPEMVTIETNT